MVEVSDFCKTDKLFVFRLILVEYFKKESWAMTSLPVGTKQLQTWLQIGLKPCCSQLPHRHHLPRC
jgi:hypothetical protein